MNKIIKEYENPYMKKDIPNFRSGDTVEVQIKVKEGNRTRIQTFIGVIISKKNKNLNSSFTIRKMSHGEGEEREEKRGEGGRGKRRVGEKHQRQ